MERRLSNRQRTGQSGYALILMIVGLMGIGGVVIAGFTQGAKQDTEHQRYLHNQRILREAKQALLQYAYNYPQLGPGQNDGPGRLLCPDTNNDIDGLEEYVANCAGNIVGRFPWGDPDLNFYEALDASGERLWYAVSPNFGRGPNRIINSGSFGGISVEDRSGARLYNGAATIPAGGVVAVIIAPGAPIARNGAMQVRGSADEKKDAANYLDLFGARDNAVFVNGGANGFVTGPILDVVTGDLLVNDQMIVITAAEVIAMAEMATLQAYRDAINAYLGRTGGVYPWLYNYRGISSIAELSSYYPAFTDFDVERDPDPDPDPDTGYLDNYGRIPSIFGEYFGSGKTEKIQSTLNGEIEIDFGSLGSVASTGIGALDFSSVTLTESFESPSVVTEIGFENLAGEQGRFTATLADPIQIDAELYFRGSHNDTSGVYSLCPDGADDPSDCDDSIQISVLRVNLLITIPATTITIDTDHAVNAPTDVVTSAATGISHARIEGKYDLTNALLTGNMPGVITVSANYDYDAHYHVGYFFGEHDGFVSGDLTVDDLLLDSNMTISMRYFPEIPNWAFTNDWHNSIRMAYADISLPSLAGDCVPAADADNTNDCLSLPDEQGARRDIASLLVIAGEHDWVDDNANAPVIVGLEDELRDVFDDGNENNNRSFSSARGNDQILIIAPQ
jgi:hypothetical protein